MLNIPKSLLKPSNLTDIVIVKNDIEDSYLYSASLNFKLFTIELNDTELEYITDTYPEISNKIYIEAL
jgi:hypothetical protein